MQTAEIDLLDEMVQFNMEEPEEKTKQTSYFWDANEFPAVTQVATQIERMGFSIASYDENTLMHRWIANDWECFIYPNTGIVRLNYRQPSGTMFSELVMSVRETRVDTIVEAIAESYFIKGDAYIDTMIAKDKERWNKLYADKLGYWK